MKHLWLIATVLMGIQAQAWASEIKDESREEMDIEAEASMADAQGSEYNAAFLDEKKEQQKMDTRLDVSHAEKVVRDAKTQQAYSEALIGKAQTEIQELKRQQKIAQMRSQKARMDRKMAQARLASAVRDLKAYRARVQKAQAMAMRDEKELAKVRARTAQLQSSMGIRPQMVKRPIAPVRRSQASATVLPAQVSR